MNHQRQEYRIKLPFNRQNDKGYKSSIESVVQIIEQFDTKFVELTRDCLFSQQLYHSTAVENSCRGSAERGNLHLRVTSPHVSSRCNTGVFPSSLAACKYTLNERVGDRRLPNRRRRRRRRASLVSQIAIVVA